MAPDVTGILHRVQHHDRPSGRGRSSSRHGLGSTTATTPCGCSVSARVSSSASLTVSRRTPARSSALLSAVPRGIPSSPGATATPRIGIPAASASSTSRTPRPAPGRGAPGPGGGGDRESWSPGSRPCTRSADEGRPDHRGLRLRRRRGHSGRSQDVPAFGVFGTSVIVGLTAQNTVGVRAVEAVREHGGRAAHRRGRGPAPRRAQDRHAGRRRRSSAWWPRPSARTAGAAGRRPGHGLDLRPPPADPEAEEVVRESLLPLAALVTPNLDEAATPDGRAVHDSRPMERAGETLLRLGAAAALVKGGHLAGDELTDVLVTRDGVRTYAAHAWSRRSTHGTGCTLSAAMTAGLALGQPLERAVERCARLRAPRDRRRTRAGPGARPAGPPRARPAYSAVTTPSTSRSGYRPLRGWWRALPRGPAARGSSRPPDC